MVKTVITQNNFAQGEIDERLFTNTDKEFYHKGAAKLRNMLIIPQASVQRRFGTLYIGEFLANEDIFNTRQFNFSEEVSYIIIFVVEEIKIFKNDILVHTIPTSVYTSNTIQQIKFSNAQNLLIITHPDIKPYSLKRGDTDIDWTFAPIAFKNYPTWDFRQDYDTNTFSLAILTVGIGRSLTAADPVFSPDHVGGFFSGYGTDIATSVGIARITGYTSPTVITVTIISEFNIIFKPPGGASGKDCYLAEPTFSDARGYPICSTFHDSRLIFGGAKSLADAIFLSNVNDYYNFDDTTGKIQDGATIRVATAVLETIQNLLSNKTLQIFTLSSEFSTTETLGSGFALGTFTIRKQSSIGSNTLQPVPYDNAAIYISKQGKSVYALTPTNSENGYLAQKVSNSITTLLSNPKDMAVRKSSAEDDIDLLFIINDTGTLLIFQRLASQEIVGWTLSDTEPNDNGKFKKVIQLENDIYFVVQRHVDGAVKNYIEKLSFNVFTDCSKIINQGLPITEINGLEFLDGKTVWIVADDYILEPQIVQDSKITLETPATEIKLGLAVIPEIETLPINLPPNIGDSTYRYKNISKIWIDFYLSNGLIVEGYPLPEYQFNGKLPIPPLVPTTAIKEMLLQKGQSLQPTITITQNAPLPLTLKGLGFEIEVL